MLMTYEPERCQAIDPLTGVHCDKDAEWRADKTDGSGPLLLCRDHDRMMEQGGLVREGMRL